MRNEALFEHRSTPRAEPELKATVRSEQIKALYHAPAIMLVNPINASILAAVLWPAYPAWILLFLGRAHLRCRECAFPRSGTLSAATA